MRVEDEHGAPWLVKSGDPANQYRNKLIALGYDFIVLPRVTLVTGELPFIDPDHEVAAENVVSHVRMLDCLAILEN